MTFVAQFPGRCVDCDGPIKAGDEIGRTASGGYAHAVCPDDPTPEPRPTRFQGTSLDDMGY